ncbi:MAG: hypothetical protein SGILL_006414, partial [Bacillariaceae sp.]
TELNRFVQTLSFDYLYMHDEAGLRNDSDRESNSSDFDNWTSWRSSTTAEDNTTTHIFMGSSRLEPPPAPGIDVFTHVCLRDDRWTLYTYGDDENENNTQAEVKPTGKGTFSAVERKSLQEWAWDSSPENSTYIDQPTLHFQDMVIRPHGNPAHCLNDVIFSLIHNNTQQQQQAAGPATYQSYVYGTTWRMPSRFQQECPEDKSWCCHALKSAGWIPQTNPVYPNFTNPHIKKRMLCFHTLVVPRIESYRHSVDPYSLQEFQRRVRNGLALTGSWNDDTEESNLNKTAHILLYDRHGSRRRVYNNSEAMVEYLQRNYKATVHRIGPEWNSLNPTEQAAVYDMYPYIVAPHGAHLANLIYAKPGTKFIELQCAFRAIHGKQVRSSQSILSRNSTTTMTGQERRAADLEWYGSAVYHREGHTKWFTSLSEPLNMEHFVFVEKAGCEDENGNLDSGYSPPHFNVDPIEFGDYVASRFGLHKQE